MIFFFPFSINICHFTCTTSIIYSSKCLEKLHKNYLLGMYYRLTKGSFRNLQVFFFSATAAAMFFCFDKGIAWFLFFFWMRFLKRSVIWFGIQFFELVSSAPAAFLSNKLWIRCGFSSCFSKGLLWKRWLFCKLYTEILTRKVFFCGM